MKKILLLLVLASTLFSLTINESMLKIHSVLIPKILLMDYKITDKISNSTMKIAIVYKNSEYKYAKSLKKKIDTRYKDGIKSFKIVTKLVKYRDVHKSDANIYYLFPSGPTDIEKTIKYADKNSALTFSYFRNDLEYGVMISLDISKKIKTVINLDAIKLHNISLRPILLEISSIYRGENEI